MEFKKHFKLYKSGKQWVVAAVATVSVATGLTLGAIDIVHADNQQSNISSTVVVPNNLNDDIDNSSKEKVEQSDVDNQGSKDDSNLTQSENTLKTNESSNSLENNTNQKKDLGNANLESSQTGWQTNSKGEMEYYQNGKLLSGRQYVNLPTMPGTNAQGSTNWYLMDNGIAQSGVQQWAGTYYAFNNENYLRIDNDYVTSQWGLKYMFGKDGRIVTGLYKWDKNDQLYYFDPTTYLAVTNKYIQANDGNWYLFTANGTAASRVARWAGTYYYFDPVTHLRVDNDYVQSQWGDWYLFGKDGRILSGVQRWAGTYYYFDPTTYLRVDNDYVQSQWGDWYMFGKDGRIVTGPYSWMGAIYYFDPTTYLRVDNDYRTVGDGSTGYLLGSDGRALSGVQKWMGSYYYFDPTTYLKQNNVYAQSQWGDWYMFGKTGQIVTGLYNWMGSTYYFDPVTYLRTDNKWVNGQYFGTDGVRYQNRLLIQNNKAYYFDGNGNPVKNTTMTIDGTQYTFDANGVATVINSMAPDDAAIQEQRSQIAAKIASLLKNKGTIDYDWNNQDDNFAAFSMHDTAQLVAMGKKNALDKAAGKKLEGNQGLDADPATIEKNLANNTLLTGKVQSIFVHTYNASAFKNTDVYTTQVANDFIQQLNLANVDGDILGVGSNYDDTTQQLIVTALLFKKGPAAPKPAQATSTVPSATITNVYNKDVTVPNAHKIGDTVDNTELSGALAGINHVILTGNKGEVIPQDILQLYYDALVGAEGEQGKTGFVGQKIYTNQNGDYHYVYWLEANKGDIKNNAWQIFMNENKGVKYGDPIKVDVSATLTWGKPTAKPVSGIPTSEMTAEQINTAYATGSDSGASHEPVKIEKINNFDNSAAKGVDIGSLIALEKAGVTFYNFDGQPDDLFNILQQAGVNYIRARVWNDPYDATNATYGGGNSDEAHLMEIAKRAKAHGMSLMMDFHYSDFWADPATQIVPKAWQGEDPATMKQSVYNYTKKVLQDLKATGVNVGMVQIGNEITRGILTSQTDGNFWTNPTTGKQGSAYLSAGSQAVREVMPQAKVLLHLESLGQDNYRNIMNVWKNNGVDYDVLATSAYLFWIWSNEQYSVQDVYNGVVNMITNDFGKQVVVTETSWPFTDMNSDGTTNTTNGAGSAGYQVGPQGQVDAMRSFWAAISNSQRGKNLGVFWWEPAWIPAKAGWNYYQYNVDAGDTLGTGWAAAASLGYYPDSKLYYDGKPTWGGTSWDNQTLFDDNGHPLQSLKMFKGFQDGYTSPNYQQVANKPDSKPSEQVTSPLQLTVTEIYSNNINVNNALKVNDTVTVNDVNNLLNADITKLLTGDKGKSIPKDSLNKLTDTLNHALAGKTIYTDAAGKKYHYTFWIAGQTITDKEWQVNDANKSALYGSTITIPVTATLEAE